MTLWFPTLPGPLVYVQDFIVGHWPEGDEDAMRRAAGHWSDMAEKLKGLQEPADQAMNSALSAIDGQIHDAMSSYWKDIGGDDGELKQLIDACDSFARQLEEGATDIEHTKISIYISVGIMVAMLLWSWVPGVGQAEEAGTIVAGKAAIQAAFRKLLSKLGIDAAKFMEKRGAKLLVNAGVGSTLGAGTDLAAQGIQIAEGTRKNMDWKSVGLSTLSGALAGTVAGPVGEKLGEGVAAAAAKADITSVTSNVGKAVTAKTSEVVGNVVGNAVAGTTTSVVTGQHVDLTNVWEGGGGGLGNKVGVHPNAEVGTHETTTTPDTTTTIEPANSAPAQSNPAPSHTPSTPSESNTTPSSVTHPDAPAESTSPASAVTASAAPADSSTTPGSTHSVGSENPATPQSDSATANQPADSRPDTAGNQSAPSTGTGTTATTGGPGGPAAPSAVATPSPDRPAPPTPAGATPAGTRTEATVARTPGEIPPRSDAPQRAAAPGVSSDSIATSPRTAEPSRLPENVGAPDRTVATPGTRDTPTTEHSDAITPPAERAPLGTATRGQDPRPDVGKPETRPTDRPETRPIDRAGARKQLPADDTSALGEPRVQQPERPSDPHRSSDGKEPESQGHWVTKSSLDAADPGSSLNLPPDPVHAVPESDSSPGPTMPSREPVGVGNSSEVAATQDRMPKRSEGQVSSTDDRSSTPVQQPQPDIRKPDTAQTPTGNHDHPDLDNGEHPSVQPHSEPLALTEHDRKLIDTFAAKQGLSTDDVIRGIENGDFRLGSYFVLDERPPDLVQTPDDLDPRYLTEAVEHKLKNPLEHRNYASVEPDTFRPGCPEHELPAHLTRSMPDLALERAATLIDPDKIMVAETRPDLNPMWRDLTNKDSYLDAKHALFRMDSRGPEIFDSGLQPRNPRVLDISVHVGNAHSDGFVSLSKSPEQTIARETSAHQGSSKQMPDGTFRQIMYMHELYTPHGVDVDATFHDATAHSRHQSGTHKEAEVLAPGGISGEAVYRLWPREIVFDSSGKPLSVTVGEPIYNPHFTHHDNPRFAATHDSNGRQDSDNSGGHSEGTNASAPRQHRESRASSLYPTERNSPRSDASRLSSDQPVRPEYPQAQPHPDPSQPSEAPTPYRPESPRFDRASLGLQDDRAPESNGPESTPAPAPTQQTPRYPDVRQQFDRNSSMPPRPEPSHAPSDPHNQVRERNQRRFPLGSQSPEPSPRRSAQEDLSKAPESAPQTPLRQEGSGDRLQVPESPHGRQSGPDVQPRIDQRDPARMSGPDRPGPQQDSGTMRRSGEPGRRPSQQELDTAWRTRQAREAYRSWRPEDDRVTQVPDRRSPNGKPAFDVRRLPDAKGGPIEVARIKVHVTGDENVHPDRLRKFWETSQMATDLEFNRGQRLLSGDWMMVDLVPTQNPAEANLHMHVSENPGAWHPDVHPDAIARQVREQLGLPPNSDQHGLSPDEIRHLSNQIADANTPTSFRGDLGLQYGQGHLRPLEDVRYQHAVEDALRDGNRFVVGADPRTNKYGQLINDGGPSKPGRRNNCMANALAAISCFRGVPRVAHARWADTTRDGRIDDWSGEVGADERAKSLLGGKWQDWSGPIDQGFSALHDHMRQLGPGSAALVVNGWHAHDQVTGQPLYHQDGSPVIGGTHATVIVYPHDASGPVWWDPQASRMSDRPPAALMNRSGSLQFMPVPPDRGAAYAGPEHPGTSPRVSGPDLSRRPGMADLRDPGRLGVPAGPEPGADRDGPGAGSDESGDRRGLSGGDRVPELVDGDGRGGLREQQADGAASERRPDLSAPVAFEHPADAGNLGNDRVSGPGGIPGEPAGGERGVPAENRQEHADVPVGPADGRGGSRLGGIAEQAGRDLAGPGGQGDIEPQRRADAAAPSGAADSGFEGHETSQRLAEDDTSGTSLRGQGSERDLAAGGRDDATEHPGRNELHHKPDGGEFEHQTAAQDETARSNLVSQRFDELPYPHEWTIGQDENLMIRQERQAVTDYTLGTYRTINEALRGRTPMTPDVEADIETLRNAIMKYPLNKTYRVSRETNATDLGLAIDNIGKGLIGKSFRERSFMSTSGLKNPPKIVDRIDPIILDIVVPEGTPALMIGGNLSGVAEIERELLIIDGRRLRVVDVHWDDELERWRLQTMVARDRPEPAEQGESGDTAEKGLSDGPPPDEHGPDDPGPHPDGPAPRSGPDDTPPLPTSGSGGAAHVAPKEARLPHSDSRTTDTGATGPVSPIRDRAEIGRQTSNAIDESVDRRIAELESQAGSKRFVPGLGHDIREKLHSNVDQAESSRRGLKELVSQIVDHPDFDPAAADAWRSGGTKLTVKIPGENGEPSTMMFIDRGAGTSPALLPLRSPEHAVALIEQAARSGMDPTHLHEDLWRMVDRSDEALGEISADSPEHAVQLGERILRDMPRVEELREHLGFQAARSTAQHLEQVPDRVGQVLAEGGAKPNKRDLGEYEQQLSKRIQDDGDQLRSMVDQLTQPGFDPRLYDAWRQAKSGVTFEIKPDKPQTGYSKPPQFRLVDLGADHEPRLLRVGAPEHRLARIDEQLERGNHPSAILRELRDLNPDAVDFAVDNHGQAMALGHEALSEKRIAAQLDALVESGQMGSQVDQIRRRVGSELDQAVDKWLSPFRHNTMPEIPTANVDERETQNALLQLRSRVTADIRAGIDPNIYHLWSRDGVAVGVRGSGAGVSEVVALRDPHSDNGHRLVPAHSGEREVAYIEQELRSGTYPPDIVRRLDAVADHMDVPPGIPGNLAARRDPLAIEAAEAIHQQVQSSLEEFLDRAEKLDPDGRYKDLRPAYALVQGDERDHAQTMGDIARDFRERVSDHVAAGIDPDLYRVWQDAHDSVPVTIRSGDRVEHMTLLDLGPDREPALVRSRSPEWELHRIEQMARTGEPLLAVHRDLNAEQRDHYLHADTAAEAISIGQEVLAQKHETHEEIIAMQQRSLDAAQRALNSGELSQTEFVQREQQIRSDTQAVRDVADRLFARGVDPKVVNEVKAVYDGKAEGVFSHRETAGGPPSVVLTIERAPGKAPYEDQTEPRDEARQRVAHDADLRGLRARAEKRERALLEQQAQARQRELELVEEQARNAAQEKAREEERARERGEAQKRLEARKAQLARIHAEREQAERELARIREGAAPGPRQQPVTRGPDHSPAREPEWGVVHRLERGPAREPERPLGREFEPEAARETSASKDREPDVPVHQPERSQVHQVEQGRADVLERQILDLVNQEHGLILEHQNDAAREQILDFQREFERGQFAPRQAARESELALVREQISAHEMELTRTRGAIREEQARGREPIREARGVAPEKQQVPALELPKPAREPIAVEWRSPERQLGQLMTLVKQAGAPSLVMKEVITPAVVRDAVAREVDCPEQYLERLTRSPEYQKWLQLERERQERERARIRTREVEGRSLGLARTR